MEPNDWEPLPAEQMVLHPGELPTSRPAPPPVAAATSPPAVEPPRSAPAPEDPQAELLLQQLKARLASAPPARSLLAEVARREQKSLRQWRAAQATQLAECLPVQRTASANDLPLALQYDSGEHGRDDREEEEWFRMLPAPEQQRLQTAWAGKRGRALGMLPVQRRNQNRRTVAAILVSTAVVLAGSGERWHATLGAGICCGIWWRHVVPCRFRDPILAFGCLLAAQLIAWAADGGNPPSQLFMDAILLVALAAVVGFDGEIRRTGGFDAK